MASYGSGSEMTVQTATPASASGVLGLMHELHRSGQILSLVLGACTFAAVLVLSEGGAALAPLLLWALAPLLSIGVMPYAMAAIARRAHTRLGAANAVSAVILLGLPWSALALPVLSSSPAVAAALAAIPVISVTYLALSVSRWASIVMASVVAVAHLGAGIVGRDGRTVVVVAGVFAFSLAVARVARRRRTAELELETRWRDVIHQLDHERHALKRANATLEFRANHDMLLGIPNRELLQRELAAALTVGEKQVGLLFVDLDHFKYVNDSLGHSAGDELLQALSQRMTNALALSDAVLARVGGDEFVVLLRSVDGANELRTVANRLLRAARQPFTIDGVNLTIGVSIGMALAGPDDTADSLYRIADAALYEAKSAGRNQVRLADSSLRHARAYRIRTELAFRTAFQSGAVQSWYQPEVDLLSGEVVAAESLARWLTDDRVLTASSFIDAAERTGLTEQLAHQALDQFAEWSETHPHLELGVNVSFNHLRSVLQRCAVSDLNRPLSGIRLELPETDIVSDFGRARAMLEQARKFGARIVLDDFGTGYSSLRMLTDLPIDGLKIDRTYVDRLISDVRVRELVTGIAEFGRRAGMLIVAEGLETPEQADFLLQVGITRAQGYLFARALPADEFASFVEAGPIPIELQPTF